MAANWFSERWNVFLNALSRSFLLHFIHLSLLFLFLFMSSVFWRLSETSSVDLVSNPLLVLLWGGGSPLIQLNWITGRHVGRPWNCCSRQTETEALVRLVMLLTVELTAAAAAAAAKPQQVSPPYDNSLCLEQAQSQGWTLIVSAQFPVEPKTYFN